MELPFDITLAQLNPTVGDLNGNADKIHHVWNSHPDTDLIIFSEMFITGYPADDLLCRPSFIDETRKKILGLVKESKNKPAILIGTPWENKGVLYNAALLIADGKIQHVSLKNKLPNYGIFDERRYFESAPLQDVFVFKNITLGIMTCEDMWFPDSAAQFKKQGAEILLVINGSPYQTAIWDIRKNLAKDRVQETALPLVYVNQVGGQDDLVFDGNSFVMNEKGEITHQLPAFEETIHSIRKPVSMLELSPEETLYKAVTLGLKDYAHKNGFKGVLIGLSGGIDSALSAVIAVDALGAENVHCVMMPSPYTSQDSLDDAAECAKLLGVKLDTISIEPAMAAYGDILTEHIDENNAGTTFENIQSRIRGATLMALSNANGALLLSTGNKSEMAVGYATLYGDMCGGYNALKDLYKTQVYKLAQWRNTQSHVIPERIITKAPSAELKLDQTDQDTLPPYDILDDILKSLIEKEMAIDDIAHDSATVLKVSKMLRLAEYKRRQAPPGPKVTNKAFGRDRRYPITNGFEKK